MRVRATYTGHRPDFYVIRSVFRDEDGPVGRDLDDMSRRVLDRARVLVGVSSGTLLASGRRSTGQGPLGPYADVIFGVPGITSYLADHMFGAPPHVIRPRRRKALRYIQNGRVVFARRVHHPGNKPNPFLTRALGVLR